MPALLLVENDVLSVIGVPSVPAPLIGMMEVTVPPPLGRGVAPLPRV